jgi:glycosyltransferase involved in cell wall biosynthesis
MLQCKPVVVTPRGGMPEQVEDGCTGVVAAGVGPRELAAAVMRAVADGPAAARLAREGRRAAAQKFSLDRWLEETINALAEAAR